MACSARGRTAAGAVLPHSVHAAGRDQRDRLPEQAQGLRITVHGRGRGAHRHCRRSQAPRRQHRRHRRPAHLGSEPPASSPCSLHRARRWPIAGWQALDCLQAQASFFRSAYSPACSGACSCRVLKPCTLPASCSSSPISALSRMRTRSERTSRRCARLEWVVYAKKPFAGPKQVLAYLARYTHRVAIANSRLLDLDETHVSFRWKDYRESGAHKSKVMRLDVGEFMRRFLLHVLPSRFHRIRHYGLFANGHRADKLTLCRHVLDVPSAPTHRDNDDNAPAGSNHELPPCPCCGGRMIIIEVFDGPLSRPSHVRRLDGL